MSLSQLGVVIFEHSPSEKKIEKTIAGILFSYNTHSKLAARAASDEIANEHWYAANIQWDPQLKQDGVLRPFSAQLFPLTQRTQSI